MFYTFVCSVKYQLPVSGKLIVEDDEKAQKSISASGTLWQQAALIVRVPTMSHCT